MLEYVSCSRCRLPCLSVSRLVILFSLGEPPSPVVTYLVSSSERLGGGWRKSRKEKELPLCRWRVQQVRMVGMVKALPSRPALPLLRANSHQLRERLKVSQQILLLVSCLKQIFVTIITVIVANGKCFGCRSEVSPARSEA